MPRRLVIENVTAVLPEGMEAEASVEIEDGVIAEIRHGSFARGGQVVNGAGQVLLPGFIDLHSDAIEKEIEPRPRTSFPIDYAIHELDKRLATCGVTTIFHALSFADGEMGPRSTETATRVVIEVNQRAPYLKVKTRVHTRFEITDSGAVPILSRLIDQGQVQLLSFMDHTPGQGQFREVTSFKEYYGAVYSKSDEELEEIIASKQRTRAAAAPESVRTLLECGHARGIPLASHDVDSAERIRWLKEHGIAITEFPIDMATTRAASEAGIHVMLGAPNVLRGVSQAGNLSARQAIAAGHGDLLCSDYAPQTLLHAIVKLVRQGILPLHESVKLVSLGPAQAAGIADRTGSIQPGKDADLVLVDLAGDLPQVKRTFVAGREVFATE